MKTLVICLAGLLFALASTGQAAQPAAPSANPPVGSAGGDFALNLARPWARGDSYTMSLDLAIHAEGGSGQGVEFWSPQSENRRVTFSGKVRVIDVNAAGEGTTLVVHVDKASITERDTTRAMKVEGADLGVSFPLGQTNLVRRDGQPIPPGEASVLKEIFTPPKSVSEAEFLSPPGAVKPGEKWPMKKEVLAKALSGAAPAGAAPPEITEGEVTFEGVETIGATASYHLVARWAFKSGDRDRFTGTSVTQVKEDLFLPQDPKSKASLRAMELTGRVTGKVRNAENQLLDVKGLTKVTRKLEIKQD